MAEEKLFDRTRDLMKQISTQRKIIFTAVSVAVVALIVILAVMQPWKFNEGKYYFCMPLKPKNHEFIL